MHDLNTIREMNQTEIDKHAATKDPRPPRTRREASLIRENQRLRDLIDRQHDRRLQVVKDKRELLIEVRRLRNLMEKQQDSHTQVVSEKRELFRKNNELMARLSELQEGSHRD